MTNAEKFLKDGVEKENLAVELVHFLDREYQNERHCYTKIVPEYIVRFFEEQIKPTLSEDEKVILKKLRYEKGAYEFMKIGRTELDSEGGCDLILIDFDNDTTWFGEYGHLFQFIEPRRRI